MYEQRLLEAGLELIKQNGLKRLRIEDIARKSGFAKSTFYTFFSSKEEFVCKIALYERKKNKEAVQQLFNENEKMNKEAAKQFFKIQFLSDANIYPYLSKEDYEYLRARCPELYHLDPESDEENTKWLLGKMDTGQVCDWKLFSNYVKAIVTVTMNAENLYGDIYKETIELMINGLVDFIFE
ncbi:TetR/AcrR family transcriptional regulator [Clostridium aminobutyricum]|uniref:Helix-turn-helix transcriptional regulator n=1 Tax=Clostridium aminobutyricum TaxID=33953 RepID=A0A939IJU1_CLOAM|nr:TetR/AcrR family transcriptional regulator [Clostridium aminobutyricum]MBN7773924.1 helix-turn-helix transcriptional regulator [Clostridium aminobutyricum]